MSQVEEVKEVVIQDLVRVVDPALKKTKNYFMTGKTRPISYRIEQLRLFKKGIQDMETELSDALKKDLGRDNFMNWFTEISGLYSDIDHTISHLA
jgi:aldehyde dehydrogenase (NAD+)